jgi:hypothetical protein
MQLFRLIDSFPMPSKSYKPFTHSLLSQSERSRLAHSLDFLRRATFNLFEPETRPRKRAKESILEDSPVDSMYHSWKLEHEHREAVMTNAVS